MAQIAGREPDLRDPGILERSTASEASSNWQLFSVVNGLLLFYSLIHKFFVPSTKTLLLGGTFLDILRSWDYWWLLHVVLIWPIRKKSKPLMIWLSSFGLAVCLARIGILTSQLMADQGRVGWMTISIWMTEGLSALFLAYVLVHWKAFQFLPVILGVGVGYFYPAYTETKTSMPTRLVRNESRRFSSVQKDIREGSSCGLFAFKIQKGEVSKMPIQNVETIEKCGFNSTVLVATQDVQLKNKSGHFLNVRIEGWKGERGAPWVFERNISIFEGQSISVPLSVVQRYPFIRLSSDSWKEAGLLAIMSASNLTKLPNEVDVETGNEK